MRCAHGEVLDAPDQVVLIVGNVDEACMWLASAAIFYEHLAPLNHLDVVVLGQGLSRVEVEEGTHTTQDLLNVLRIRLELVLANSLINLLELRHWVLWRPLTALLDKLVKREPMLRVDARVMVQCVEEDETVGQ